MQRPKISRLAPPLAALSMALAVLVPTTSSATSVETLPIATGEKSKIASAISPVGDEDQFGLDLLVGDRVKVKVADNGPGAGLLSTLTLFDPTGADTRVPVSKQGTFRPSFQFTASRAGTHTVNVAGGPDGFDGAEGGFTISTKIKRAKLEKRTFADAGGGNFAYAVGVTEGALLSLSVSAKSNGFNVNGLRRPDGELERDFLAALSIAKSGKKAKLKKFAVTGGFGTYVLEGTYTAGVSVKVGAKVKRVGGKVTGRIGDNEPAFDPLFHSVPVPGIEGTVITVFGRNFEYAGVDHQPTFSVGVVPVPPETVEFVLENVFKFPIPTGLSAGSMYDLRMRNPDGQGARVGDGFDYVPAPNVTGIDVVAGGPGGGRTVTVSGSLFRGGSVVLFDDAVAQPLLTFDDRIVVKTPAHSPGLSKVYVRDEHGQMATSPDDFEFLDIPFTRVFSIAPAILQGTGGEVVTLTGEDLSAIETLRIDGREVETTPVDDMHLTFVAPTHSRGTVRLEAESSMEQVSGINVVFLEFFDESGDVVPDPRLVTDEADGWRTNNILRGDVNGDGVDDAILLRKAAAFGSSAKRPRVRVLLGGGDGTFSDSTAASAPMVSAVDDWRAVGGTLFDKDDDDDLDLAIVTLDELDGGDRSSLRILENVGVNSGVFSDVTTGTVPIPTSYGDRNQGEAVIAADVDGDEDIDLIVIHNDFFTEVVITAPEPTEPPQEPPPDPIIETFYHAGTRILVNDGDGVFTLDEDLLPDVDPADATQLQGETIAAANVDGESGVELLLTRDDPVEDPDNPGQYLVTAVLLQNDGDGNFTDASATLLPGKADPEYLQGDYVQFVDITGDGALDLLVGSNTPIISPKNGALSDAAATRFFKNNGSGVFSAMPDGTFPDPIQSDRLQSEAAAVGDLNGDGTLDIAVVSATAPDALGRAARILVQVDGKFRWGSEGLPSPLSVDDGRGASVLMWDLDDDGDLDLFIGRDTPSDTVRNLRAFSNPRK